MEVLLLIIGFALFVGYLSNNTSNSVKNTTSYTSQADIFKSDEPKTNSTPQEEKATVNNIFIQQNTINIQVNNNQTNKGSGGHTKKIWQKLGYKVKYGESYAYKFYGNEIYRPEQVESISTNYVKYSERGLIEELLRKTKSKYMTQKILVEQYGYPEVKAKKLLNYI